MGEIFCSIKERRALAERWRGQCKHCQAALIAGADGPVAWQTEASPGNEKVEGKLRSRLSHGLRSAMSNILPATGYTKMLQVHKIGQTTKSSGVKLIAVKYIRFFPRYFPT